jgi:glycine cleavage system aminomethyltransferase T
VLTAGNRYGGRAVSIHAEPPRVDHELDAVVARAGAIHCDHDGRRIALHYGSAAGELAACVSRVGLADRSELTKLALEGPQPTLQQVISSLTGGALASGGAIRTGPAWWCGVSPERVLVLAEPGNGDRLHSRIRRLVAPHPALRIRDLSVRCSAIAIVGRHAGNVLAQLGVYGETGDPRSVAPVSLHRVGGADVTWLLQSDHRALAIMDHGDAPEVWHALHAAGRPFGICAVGEEAIVRYALLARTAPGR